MIADGRVDSQGKIPKNKFGNIDLWVPSMLPAGSTHIGYKGTSKIARDLKLNYAEAVTGFEFKNRRAIPILKGIVLATENVELFMDVSLSGQVFALLY